MKYLSCKLNEVPATIEADGEVIKIRIPGEEAVFSIVDGEMEVAFAEIVEPEPAPAPKPKGVKRHSRKAKEAKKEEVEDVGTVEWPGEPV